MKKLKPINTMKKTLPLLLGGLLMILANTGCMQDKAMDAKDISQRADSIYNADKGKKLDSLKMNCDTSMSRMVMMKADSMYQASKSIP